MKLYEFYFDTFCVSVTVSCFQVSVTFCLLDLKRGAPYGSAQTRGARVQKQLHPRLPHLQLLRHAAAGPHKGGAITSRGHQGLPRRPDIPVRAGRPLMAFWGGRGRGQGGGGVLWCVRLKLT